MINTEGMIAETATKIYTDLCPREVPHEAEAGKYPQALWDALAENGLPLAWVSEENGGFDADYDEVFGAIWASAEAASPVPFAETLIANWLLDRAGRPLADGSASFAISSRSSQARSGDGSTPTEHMVPFGSLVDQIIFFNEVDRKITVYAGPDTDKINLDHLSPDNDARVSFSNSSPIVESAVTLSRRAVEALILTVRAVQMAAAIEAALNLTLEYVSQREQFGRPLAKFQAIQQQLAVAASESAAATMAATQAAAAFTRHRDNPEQAWHEAVIAKVQIGHSVEAVTEPFHQVHGAMGYTEEYDLHHYTRRLWAWRDALGNEHHWSRILGAELAGASADQIWKGVTTGQWIAS